MTASAVNLRSVRHDQRRVAALLGASRQVPVPPFNYPKVTIDNLFKSRFYRELEKRGDDEVSESQNRLEVQSKHLQSYYNLRKNVEKGVSKKIEAIRNRAENVKTSSEKEEGRGRETRNKRKKRKNVVDIDEKETWRKLKGTRRNSKTSLDEGLERDSNKQWTWNNLGDLKVGSHASASRSQPSKTYHDNSTELQLSNEGPNTHLHETTPFRLPKLQIPVRREEERGTSKRDGQKQMESESLPPLSSRSPPRSNETHPVMFIESVAPDGEDSSRIKSPFGGIKNITSHSESQRIKKKQSSTGRKKLKTKEKSFPESYQNGNSQEIKPNNTEGKTSSDDFGASEEGFLKVGELSLVTESEIVNHESSDEYEEMSNEDEYTDRIQSQENSRSTTIRRKIPSRVKWNPNNHSEIMRRKLNTLMRKRRLARLDRIRLGQFDETDQAIDMSSYTDSERTVQVMHESALEFGKTENVIKHTKTKKRGRRKSHVTSKTTSRPFSYSYFA